MMVLDTHVLLWWALDPEKLSSPAQTALATIERVGGFASAMSIWELGIKIKQRQLRLPISIDEFAARIEKSSVIELIAVDTKIWLRSLSLAWDHRDPADRVIVATALNLNLPLITKDELIRVSSLVSCVW
jgi:PIN domain nuclease of toxin-antitoxin system